MNLIIKRVMEGKPSQTQLSTEETLFHSANGYLGVRCAFEEGYPEGCQSVRGAYLNGVYDLVHMPQAEPLFGLVNEKQTMVNVADVQTLRCFVNGTLLSSFAEGSRSERTLDMEEGVVRRTLRHSLGTIILTRLASFSRLPIFAMRATLTVGEDAEVKLETKHDGNVRNFADPNDPRVASEAIRHILVDSVSFDGDHSTLVTHTSKSAITVSSTIIERLDRKAESVHQTQDGESVTTVRTLHLRQGESVTITRYVAFSDSLRSTKSEEDSRLAAQSAASAGFVSLLSEQKAYLDDFWRHVDIGIDGDDGGSLALAFNLYELLQSAGRDSHGHLAAKGLSGEGYEGHYFWDTEIYVQPFFTLTMPSLSRTLLSYRYAILPQARENARLLGHAKGALYPWRTISGSECSGFFPAGTAQYHIDGAVAYAVVQYYLVTGDDDFMETMGLEMLLEIARLWFDLGVYVKGSFCLHCVTGPDEYTCLVDNNYYTNACAKYDLAWAVRFYREFRKKGKSDTAWKHTEVTDSELDAFQKASDAMYLPYDRESDVSPQDDSFLQKKRWDIAATPKEKFPLLLHYHPLTLYRYQVCKQADTVLAHFLYEDLVSDATRLHSFRYYEQVTTHDSSLSKCIFSIVAAKLGLVDKACAYLGRSIETDLNDTNVNTKDGIHTANMGGSYLALVFGFGGLRIKETGLSLNPVLPTSWKGYHFTVRYHGVMLSVHVEKRSILVKTDTGNELAITIGGKPLLVTDKGVREMRCTER